MKTPLLLLCGLLLAAVAAPTRAQSPAAAAPLLNAEQLEQLLAPIALYPDALVALMLPAATAPADLVLAARHLHENGDTASIEGRPWDESVKSLCHFPSVLKWMDQNLAWTKQLGEAFRDQPAEVMQAIQRLRARARAAGTLRDSAQQQVVVDGDVITIIPAQTNAIYIPYYDPTVVYYRPANIYPGTYFTFGGAVSVGSWLSFECDWWNRTIWVAPRRVVDHGQRDWRRPVFPGRPGYVAEPERRPWRPAPTSPRAPTFTGGDRPHGDGARSVPPPNPPGERKDAPGRRDGPSARDRGISPTTAVVNPPTLDTTTPSPAVTGPARRRFEPSRERTDTLDQSTRASRQPSSPAAPPAANPSHHFPYGQIPSGAVVAPMSGTTVPPMSSPLVAPMSPPAARASAAPPAAAPVRTPTAGPPQSKRRDGGDGSERRNEQPN